MVDPLGGWHHVGAPLQLAHPARLADDLTVLEPSDSRNVSGLDQPRSCDHLRTQGEMEHDAFFGIQRVASDAATSWRAALTRTHREIDGQSIAQTHIRQVPGLLDDLTQALPPPYRPLVDTPASASATPWTAFEWWVQGHRMFAVLTQGATVGMRHACRRVRLGDLRGAEQGLDSTGAFFVCSATALGLTAGFGIDEYREQVRPLMAPPRVSAGFSGVLSVDHRMLVAALREWRQYAGIPELRDGCARLRTALAAVYAAHEGVCERFVGAAAPSLRTATASRPSAAVAVLHDLGQRRIGLLTANTPSVPFT
jgi:hypothetical protein